MVIHSRIIISRMLYSVAYLNYLRCWLMRVSDITTHRNQIQDFNFYVPWNFFLKTFFIIDLNIIFFLSYKIFKNTGNKCSANIKKKVLYSDKKSFANLSLFISFKNFENTFMSFTVILRWLSARLLWSNIFFLQFYRYIEERSAQLYLWCIRGFFL